MDVITYPYQELSKSMLIKTVVIMNTKIVTNCDQYFSMQ